MKDERLWGVGVPPIAPIPSYPSYPILSLLFPPIVPIASITSDKIPNSNDNKENIISNSNDSNGADAICFAGKGATHPATTTTDYGHRECGGFQTER